MLEEGIKGMMKDDDAMSACKNAEVLVAPHHGRDSSYVHDFVSHVNPDLVIFSEESEGEDGYTVPSKYGQVANGEVVMNEIAEEGEERFVLTTRSDGRIRIQANNETDWRASHRPNYTTSMANSRKYKRHKSY